MFISVMKDILFPIYCLDCNLEGQWLCDDCKKKIKLNFREYQAVESLDNLTAFFVYKEQSIIGKIIRLLKYYYVKEISEVIKEILDVGILDTSLPQNLTVIPVPLHARRQRERGFNQAELIANIFNDKFNLGEVKVDILRRKKYTSQQAKLKKVDRIKNLQGAFIVNSKVFIPKCILLVDDVYTTGATMQECVLTLKKAGVQYVRGMVLARGA